MSTDETDAVNEWHHDGSELVWRRYYGPWEVSARADINAPFTGPIELKIRLSIGGPDEDEIVRLMDQALETDGIPASLLRQVPFAQIKAQFRAALEPQQNQVMGEPWPVPERCRTELDYALLVAELARLRATETTAPQGELAARLGVGKATLSERVKRAKELGLWDGKRLTDKATTILNDWLSSDRKEQ
ncbi:MarR family transcriptional regulator [Streptomyces sp. SID12501]|uniref:Uncharacterized protein n=1 Tax=Streptomyces sp. SID12501 TaxID=2706042 RepID=A0A6B3C832_9ACTN|nr:MarR family transcriptional regulator [Streptomyces sp. SID12501]NEC92532.1 hypothetical protein [Streptomyces sp. SID12501]